MKHSSVFTKSKNILKFFNVSRFLIINFVYFFLIYSTSINEKLVVQIQTFIISFFTCS